MTSSSKPLSADELAGLKAKAKAATPGDPYCHDGEYIVASNPQGLSYILLRQEFATDELMDHIAAANPETILRLIDMVERPSAQRFALGSKVQIIDRTYGDWRDDWKHTPLTITHASLESDGSVSYWAQVDGDHGDTDGFRDADLEALTTTEPQT